MVLRKQDAIRGIRARRKGLWGFRRVISTRFVVRVSLGDDHVQKRPKSVGASASRV